MTRTATDRPPSYTPDSDRMFDPRWWNRRIVGYLALASLLSGAMGALGGRIVWPGEEIRNATVKNAQQDAAIAQLRATTDSIATERATDRFLLCVLVKRSQPKGAMPIKECP